MSRDERFKGIGSDPRFNLPKKKSTKAKVDSRFSSALEGEEFRQTAKTDKYGRKLEQKSAKQKLERFYDFGDDEDKEDPEKSSSSRAPTSLLDRMRGEGGSDSSSSESESSDDESEEVDADVLDLEDVAAAEIPMGEETRRLAVVNLDWDNIRAVDLMVTFSSFVPKGHSIQSVAIYPSEFGKQRMSEEDLQGPSLSNGIPKGGRKSSQETQHDKDQDYSSSALRKYQLQRLQYFYAIVTCDSVVTAASIYNNCDGSEYEATANIFDLRYVPDDAEFTDKPTSESTSVPAGYQPQDFTTTALQHSKAKLTWDETPRERQEFTARAFSRADEEDMDLKAYLASDSDEEDRTAAEKYKELLGLSKTGEEEHNEQDSDVDMQITFNSALEPSAAKETEEADPMENLSTIDKYRLKEKERRQKRLERSKARKAAEKEEEEDSEKKRAELELVLMDDDASEQKPQEEGKKPKYKQTKTRQKKQAIADAEQDFNTADPRFQALFEDPDYAIDSTNPQFKKTKAMDKVLDERRKRGPKGDAKREKRKPQQQKEESVHDIVDSLRKKKQKTR